jgi:hypothetical protein
VWPAPFGAPLGTLAYGVVVVPGVPWWSVVSSAVALVLLVGGWTVAAGLQPGSFNAVVSTISALARAATDRWVMTLALAGVGACYAVMGLARSMATTPADPRYTERSRVRVG